MSELKKTIIKSTFWSVFGTIASLLIILITNVWLARLLSPKEFGQVGVIMFFVTIASVLTESGFGGALIRKTKATKADYSTVFVTNLVFSLLCFVIIFFSAGTIANYYKDPILKELLIVSSLVLIINAFQLTQNVKLISELKFKQKSIYRFIAVFVASAIGIYSAYQGIGIWALVLIQLLVALINTILLWVFEDFYLKFYFAKKSFKELYSFGINTTLTSLLISVFDNIYQLVLARYFSVVQTGYFYQSKKLQEVPGGIIIMLTHNVVFASIAKLQDDKIRFSIVYNRIFNYILVLLGIITTVIFLYAESLVNILYGSEWYGMVFYLQLLSIAAFFYLQEIVNQVIFKVFNATRQILYLEYFKKTIQTISIVIGIYYLDLQILIIGFVITNVINYFFNYYYSRKFLEVKRYSGLITMVKILILSGFSITLILWFIIVMDLNSYEALLTIPFLLIIYIGGLRVLGIMNVMVELRNIVVLYK